LAKGARELLAGGDGTLQVFRGVSFEVVTLQADGAGVPDLAEHLEETGHVVVAFTKGRINWS